MIRKIFSIIFYIVAVLMLSGMNIFSFINFESFANNKEDLGFTVKLITLAAGGIMFLIPFGIGLVLSGLRNWKRDISIVLLSVCGYNAFVILFVVLTYFTPEIYNQLPANFFELFKNVTFGFIFYAIMISAGFSLFLWYRKTSKKQRSENKQTILHEK
jgi:hypothetical protein